MVIPRHIAAAASEGDIAVVERWLDETGPGAVNDKTEWSATLLMCCLSFIIEERHVDFARWLIARGADVHIGRNDGSLPLHYASFPGDCSSTMVSLLLESGARVNARTDVQGLTPLGEVIEQFNYCVDIDEEDEDYDELALQQTSRSALEIMKLLLKAGASIDRCKGDRSAEACMQAFLVDHQDYANDESFSKGRELIAGVRAHGSYKAYVREPHRQFLRMRSLLVRGRAKIRDRSKDSQRLERLARLPNGACWHVLSFLWEAA